MRICVNCGRRAVERPLQRLPMSMSPDLGLCDGCAETLRRRGVKSGIQREADRQLSEHKEGFIPYLPTPTCRHCASPVLYDKLGRQPLWCMACERERMSLVKGVA